MKNLTIYSRYNPAPQISLTFKEPSMTQQHFKDECDINQILKKFMQTGLLPDVGPGSYLDLSEANDYRESLHIIKETHDYFAAQTSAVRAEFNNSPAEFLEFLQNPNNRQRGIELGLFPNPNSSTPNILQNVPNLEPKSDVTHNS